MYISYKKVFSSSSTAVEEYTSLVSHLEITKLPKTWVKWRVYRETYYNNIFDSAPNQLISTIILFSLKALKKTSQFD